MSISPFSARPTPSDGESRRARLVVAIAVVGIAATLLAYAISPGVRHAVSHATHSVKHAVGNVLDHDATKRVSTAPVKPAPPRAKSTTSTAPQG
jgi:type II secretory pathway pseudopilin PulG